MDAIELLTSQHRSLEALMKAWMDGPESHASRCSSAWATS
jgi:hypothetical protein